MTRLTAFVLASMAAFAPAHAWLDRTAIICLAVADGSTTPHAEAATLDLMVTLYRPSELHWLTLKRTGSSDDSEGRKWVVYENGDAPAEKVEIAFMKDAGEPMLLVLDSPALKLVPSGIDETETESYADFASGGVCYRGSAEGR